VLLEHFTKKKLFIEILKLKTFYYSLMDIFSLSIMELPREAIKKEKSLKLVVELKYIWLPR
jgi:hypothetical protein